MLGKGGEQVQQLVANGMTPDMAQAFVDQRQISALNSLSGGLASFGNAINTGVAARRGVAPMLVTGIGGGSSASPLDTMVKMAQLQSLQSEAKERNRKGQRETAQAQAYFGMYSPQAGGTPWKNPDSGQTLTGGGFIDQAPAELRPILQTMDPDKGSAFLGSLLAEQAKRPTYEPVKDAAGNIIGQRETKSGKVDPYPQGPKAQSDMGQLAADLAAGRITQQQYDQAIAIKSKPLVQMQSTQETEQSKAFGKEIGQHYGKLYTDLQTGAMKASSENNRLDQLGSLLDKTYTGVGGESVLAAKRAAKALGIDVEGVGDAEAGRALANEFSLQLRNPAGGAGMPGAMSDSDREFLKSMTPNLAMTPEGRKTLIEARKKLNQRSVEVAKMARAYQKKNGRIDAGFEDQLQAFADANPLFAGMAPAAPPAGNTGWSIQRIQ